jgi:threonine aldolase
MSEPVIDLRSDTVTRPTPDMRRAMAEAEVGDDVFLEDPSVNRLQDRAAEVFGREAGLFVPSGTMGNLASILAQTERGQEVICEAQGHIYNYEMASMSAIAGVLPRVIETKDGILDWDQIEGAIRPDVYYRAQTAMVSIENTHNMAGGTVYPAQTSDEICDRAHERGLKVHLDGARIFNAATALGMDVATISSKFDSVQFCLSKGLGAPVGSMIVGPRALIDRCRKFRKMLGGGMRQAGVVASAGLVALEKGPARLHQDHANARYLAERLTKVPGIELDPECVQTNIVIYRLDASKFDSAKFLSEIQRRGVLAVPVDRHRVRMVTHRDVGRHDVDRAADIVEQIVGAFTKETSH